MTSNHTQLKQFSFTAFCRMGDSPRFAVLPQYNEYKRTKPSISRNCNLTDDFQWIPALQREIEDLSKIRRSQWNVGGLMKWRRPVIPAQAGICRRISKLPQSSIPLSLRKGILQSQPSFVFHHLCSPFLSQPLAQHDVCMTRPKRYLRLTLAAKAGGLPQAGSCSLNSKYLLLTFLLIKHSQS